MRLFHAFILLSLMSFPVFANVTGEETIKNEVSKEHIEQVQRIFNHFITDLGKDPEAYTIEIHKNKQINAYATFGKKVVINSGLINFIDSEPGLAFVIAHELGHIEEKHVIKGLSRQSLSAVMRFFWFKQNRLLNGIDYLHVLHYGRGHEKEADLFAEALMAKFYCDQPGKLEFFQKMAERRQDPKYMEYLQTHPLPQSRLTYLKAELEAKSCSI